MDADFVICQACFGASPQPTFTGQIEAVLECGKKAGAYIYITGDAGEIGEFCSLVSPYVGKALLALDWESGSNAKWGDLGYLEACINEVKKATGVLPLVYFPASAYPSVKPLLDRLNCGAWVAQYANLNPTGYQSAPWNEGAYDMAIFQYSASGQVQGYSGDLDLDLFYGDGEAWDAYARADKPAAVPDNQWDAEEIASLAPASGLVSGRSYYIRENGGSGSYLTPRGITADPFLWYVQQNSDRSFSFATTFGDWITWQGGRMDILVGNGSLSQRFVIKDGRIYPLQDRSCPLFNASFSFYPGEKIVPEKPAGGLTECAIKLGGREEAWYVGEGGILTSTPYYWSILVHDDGLCPQLSFMDKNGDWLTLSTLPIESSDLLEDRIGNGQPSQNWYLHGTALSPATAPYLNLDCPSNAPKEGLRLWVFSANGTSAQEWRLVGAKPMTIDKPRPATTERKTADKPKPVEKGKPMDREEEIIGDAAGAIEKDVEGGRLDADAKEIAGEMSGMIEEALGRKALARKTVRWVFAVAIVIALACIVLSALALSGCLPMWVAGLCAMIMGGTGIGGHALGISATTK